MCSRNINQARDSLWSQNKIDEMVKKNWSFHRLTLDSTSGKATDDLALEHHHQNEQWRCD